MKSEVRAFYDLVGWKKAAGECYEDARFEDLRPVSRSYITRCRRRVSRHLPARGRFLLDAGSGPVQYPEYMEYSQGYRYRLCLDFSMLALQEARRRVGEHGLYVLADVAHLPFEQGVFDGLVSMHVVYHLPAEQQWIAFGEFLRVISPGGGAAVVYSWGGHAAIPRLTKKLIPWIARVRSGLARRLKRGRPAHTSPAGPSAEKPPAPLHRHMFAFNEVRANLSHFPGLEIRAWRTLSTPALRAFIYPALLGSLWLGVLSLLEEAAPRILGRVGQYPMILFRKPAQERHPEGEGTD